MSIQRPHPLPAFSREGTVGENEKLAAAALKPGPLAIATIWAALALPLLGYAAIGSFARYVADDYCWAGLLRTEGFFQAQGDWYTGYSPPFPVTLGVNLVYG